MEKVSVLCLLLCSLSAAELQENEMIEQRKVNPESVNVTEQPPSDLLAMLRDMSAKLGVLQSRIKQLETFNKVGQVAFSASLLASGSGHTGPVNSHTTLVFRYVISNIGNAYSPNTGFFTAPVRGAYHFEFYIGAQGGPHASSVVLVKNGEHVACAWEHQNNGWGKSANGATLLLEAGDVVNLFLWQNTRAFDDINHQSTFSGHLLFPLD